MSNLVSLLLMRIWSRFTIGDGCWEWIGPRVNGYGRQGRLLAHRIVYQSMVGDIPTGLELDHLCRNRACVRPDHLEPVTRQENLRRSPLVGRSPSVNKPGGNNGMGLRTHCKNGHAFSTTNTRMPTRGKGRICRKCASAFTRAHEARTRDAE